MMKSFAKAFIEVNKRPGGHRLKFSGKQYKSCSIFGCTIVSAIFALTLSYAGSLAAQTNACLELAQSLRSALSESDLNGARISYESIWREPACDEKFKSRIARSIAMLHAVHAQREIEAGASLHSQRDLLQQGLGYARAWPILAMLGDVAHDEQDFDKAVTLYQEALKVIDDPIETPVSPAESEIARIFHRAAQSHMLAESYHPAPKTRSGRPSGLASTRIRGFKINRVPVPIAFHTGSADFTDKGLRAAADMSEYLNTQNPGKIEIVGHTDPRGGAQFNLELSRKRVGAVARYLRDRGFAGQIELVAKGESERFAIDDESVYSVEQRWQMDRRVELVR